LEFRSYHVYSQTVMHTVKLATFCGLMQMSMQVVTLDFDYFDTRSNIDEVSIYDGSSANDPLIDTVSGKYQQPPTGFTSTSEFMFIKFVSSNESGFNTSNYQGFSATYRTTTTSKLALVDIAVNVMVHYRLTSLSFQ